KDAIKASKERAVVVYNYALIEDSLGKADKAIALYKEVLALDPDNAKTKTNLGVMFMAMSPPDADTALTFFLDAYKVEKSFELENNLGSAYLAKKEYTNAITHFQNALKKSPKDQTVRFNLAKCFAEAGDYDNAKTCYVDIINADQKNYDSYIELAKVFIALKDTSSAKSYLDILRQKNPTYKKAEVDGLLSAIGN
ncbi:MAG: tetratricopeptide repeat protein, partial [Treponema sp.]|nr:tetratricopeptide repeat protein [Treponema sp.]